MREDEPPTTPILAPAEAPVFEVFNAAGGAPLVLVCEHAANAVPAALGTLGLTPGDLASHIAWDLGAGDMARRLAGALDAPLVMARYSRLVYDCNRPFTAADAIPDRSETCAVPGNAGMTAAARDTRFEEFYVPFRDAVAAAIDGRAAHGPAPAIVTVHSFTPTYFGVPRAVQLGILHDQDTVLADALLACAAATTGLRTERNAPYGPEDGVTHTLRTHALPRGLPNAMLEIRNDLIDGPAARARLASSLVQVLIQALGAVGLAVCQEPAAPASSIQGKG